MQTAGRTWIWYEATSDDVERHYYTPLHFPVRGQRAGVHDAAQDGGKRTWTRTEGFVFFPSRRHADRFALAKTSPTCANPTVLPRPEGPAGNLQRPHSCREGHEQGLGRPATEGLDDLCVRL